MLQQLPGDFLSGLPPENLAQLEALAKEQQFPPGTQIFTEASKQPDVHIILHGHVRLEMAVPGKGRKPLLSLGPGDVLAWSALLSNGRMTASAIALDSVRTASISGSRLRELCEAQPLLGYRVMKQLAMALSQRLVATRLQLLDLFQDHEPIRQRSSVPITQPDAEC